MTLRMRSKLLRLGLLSLLLMIAEGDRSEPVTPLAPTYIETPQPTPRTPIAPSPRARIDYDTKERISPMIGMVKEDIHLFSIYVDRDRQGCIV